MEYLILIYGDERAYGTITEAQLKAMYQEYGSYTQDLIKAGVMRGGTSSNPLLPRPPFVYAAVRC